MCPTYQAKLKVAAPAVQHSVEEVTLVPIAPLRTTLKSVTNVKSSTPRQKSVVGMLTTSEKVFTQFLVWHALGPYAYVAFQPPSAGVSPVKTCSTGTTGNEKVGGREQVRRVEYIEHGSRVKLVGERQARTWHVHTAREAAAWRGKPSALR